MKRLLLTTVFVALVLVLAVAAVIALKGQPASQTAAPSASSSVLAPASALAPTASNKYNFIALPLDSSDTFSYTASGLAGYVPGTQKVLKWDATNQEFNAYTVGVPGSPDFSLETSGAYFLLLDNNADNVLSLVGDVPAQGYISFTLVKSTGSGCKYNAISIPLDQDNINTASDLATNIGGIDKVLTWDASNQEFTSYTVGVPGQIDFAVNIGYPYFVCANSSAPDTWPSNP